MTPRAMQPARLAQIRREIVLGKKDLRRTEIFALPSVPIAHSPFRLHHPWRQTQSRGHLAHFRLRHGFAFFDGLFDPAQDQIFENFDVFGIDDLFGDFDRKNIPEAVSSNGDVPAADTHVHRLSGEGCSKFFLHFRSLLHHLLDIHR